jgi:hypothetical protein
VLVKENTTETTGIISSSVATVPNLEGRVSSACLAEGWTGPVRTVKPARLYVHKPLVEPRFSGQWRLLTRYKDPYGS